MVEDLFFFGYEEGIRESLAAYLDEGQNPLQLILQKDSSDFLQSFKDH